MSEKRKPVYSILLRKQGKKNLKVELFNAEDFRHNPWGGPKKYRLRVNGRWYKRSDDEQYTFMDKWKFRDLLWKSFFR